MDMDTDDYYYKKDWCVVKTKMKYLAWHSEMDYFVAPFDMIRENLNWFETVKLVGILNKITRGVKV